MSTTQRGVLGRTRVCPHCRATILESAAICPACRHHLRFNEPQQQRGKAGGSFAPFRVEGKLRPPSDGSGWEYSVLVSIVDERGEEVARQVIGVGALQPDEARTFTLAVEVTAPAGTGTVEREQPS